MKTNNFKTLLILLIKSNGQKDLDSRLAFHGIFSYLIELLLQRIIDNNITGILMRKIYAGCTFGLKEVI